MQKAVLLRLFVVFLLTSNHCCFGAMKDISDQSPNEQQAVLELQKIRELVQPLLQAKGPDLFHRHLHSILAICEDEVLKAQLTGSNHASQAEMVEYLRTIEKELSGVATHDPKTYMTEGKLPLDIARLANSDGTVQLYTVQLPRNWSPDRAYPLWVQLHGRWSDTPLALVASSLDSSSPYQVLDEDAVVLTPWVRGNSEYRFKLGSEPDIWEAINDLKTFVQLDASRWYLSGASWGGDDVWAIVMRTPDLWAAAGIMAGHPHAIPPELGLVANAANVPFYIWRGDADTVGGRVEAFNSFRTQLLSVGNNPTSVVARGAPHMYRPVDLSALHTWLFEHVRHRPLDFSYTVDTPEHRGTWGISVPIRYPEAYGNVEPNASFQCHIEGTTVRIETKGTKRLLVDLGSTGLNLSGRVNVLINGKQLYDGALPEKPLSLSW